MNSFSIKLKRVKAYYWLLRRRSRIIVASPRTELNVNQTPVSTYNTARPGSTKLGLAEDAKFKSSVFLRKLGTAQSTDQFMGGRVVCGEGPYRVGRRGSSFC